jgi:hypothetical protein
MTLAPFALRWQARAGLRTHEPWAPRPEAMLRGAITWLATRRFAPTPAPAESPAREGIAPEAAARNGINYGDGRAVGRLLTRPA